MKYVTIAQAKKMIEGHNQIIKDISTPNHPRRDFAVFRKAVIYNPTLGKPLAVGGAIANSTIASIDNGGRRVSVPMFHRDVIQEVLAD